MNKELLFMLDEKKVELKEEDLDNVIGGSGNNY